jgi:hypothetical protein
MNRVHFLHPLHDMARPRVWSSIWMDLCLIMTSNQWISYYKTLKNHLVKSLPTPLKERFNIWSNVTLVTNPGLRAEVQLMHLLAAQTTLMGQSQIGTGNTTGRGSFEYLGKSYVICPMNEHRSLQLKCINSENQ